MSETSSHRLEQLRQRAQDALSQLAGTDPAHDWAGFDLNRLIEELSVYHEELRLQNEELSMAYSKVEAERSRYELLHGVLPVPTLLVDRMGVVLEDNDVSQDWLGPPRKYQALDLRLVNALERADRPRLLRFLAGLRPGQRGQLPDLMVTGFDSRRRPVAIHGACLPANFHHDARYLLVLADHSVELAREAEQRLFRSLIDNCADWMLATDASGRLILANQAFLGAVGVPADRALGRRLTDLWPSSDLSTFTAHHLQVRDSETPATHLEPVNPCELAGAAGEVVVRRMPVKLGNGHLAGMALIASAPAADRADDS